MIRHKMGFTLVEVLIVVVIIAVLAALLLPRFFGQTERAVIGEAQQMLGAMRRGQHKWMDMTGSSASGTAVTRCGAAVCTSANKETWSRIGISAPEEAQFDFECDDVDTCTATRVSTNVYSGSKITIKYRGVDDGKFDCLGRYVDIKVEGAGCTGG